MLSNHKTWFRFIPLTIFAAVFLYMWGCSGGGGDLVAKVGSRNITADQFRSFLVGRYGQEGAVKLPVDKRMEALNQQIERELIVLDAYRQGYDKMPDAVSQSEQAADQMALQELFNKEIVSRYIDDAYLHDLYNKQGEEIRARHILIRVTNRDSIEEVQAAKKKIDAIAKEIANGADFAEEAKAKSEDETTAQDGGNLGFFTWGRMVDEFQEAAFKLDSGQVSPPVLTDYGWHLIKLEERRPIANRGTFEEQKPQLENLAQRMMGEKLRTASLIYVDSLKETRGLAYDTTNIDMILDRLNDSSVPKGEYLFDCFTEDEGKLPVATYDQGTVTLDSLGKMIASRTRARTFPDRKSLENVIDGIVVVDFLKAQARKDGIYDLPKVKDTARDAKEAIMSRQAEKAMVDDKLDVADEDLLKYYEDHKADYFTDPERTVREIFIYDKKDLADKIAGRAKKGEDFLELSKKYNEKKSTQDKDGIVGPFNSRLHGQMGKAAFALAKVGDIAGPIQTGGNYSIIRLEEILPPRQKTFGEAKNQVRASYRRDKRNEIRDNWLDQVRKQNRVSVYEKQIAHLFPEDDQPLATAPQADTTQAK
jgi:parvulin-like peptidyl-prolyl isomerase